MGRVVERVRHLHGGMAEGGKVTIERLNEDRPLLSDLEEECRGDAWAVGLDPAFI
jgi:hypothetical protein